MFPEPIHIGPLHFTVYGVMAALGILAAMVGSNRENQRIQLMTPAAFEKLVLLMLLWGLITARLFFVAANLRHFLAHPAAILTVWEGGLVFYGGPLGAAAYLAYHFLVGSRAPLREGWLRFRRFFDLGTPYLALAHAIGRLGCLAAGCCYGAPHEGILSVHYPENSRVYLVEGWGRYPIPLAESGVEFMVFLWLAHLRLHKQFHGQVTLHYILLYPAARFVLEMFRGDAVRGYVLELDTPGLNASLGLDPTIPVMLTTSQSISLGLTALAIALIVLVKRAPRSLTGR